jgi:acetyl-CoA carboxylase biotin carboxylase subunit
VVPGTLEPVADPRALADEAKRLGFPVMIKAAAGGGGKGLRLVERPEDLGAAIERAASEALAAFGDASLYLEKAILRPHHIEIQVLADAHGQVVHLFERECSIQRRHQKVLEESPSPFVGQTLRARMGEMAVSLCRRTGYRNAGTLEFLVDADGEPYFLEMNTRLQVEHPVTEMVTGHDLVKLQLRIAAGEPLPFGQADLGQRGHALECRVYAEDPDAGYLPSPGPIEALQVPGGPGVRDDSGVYAGYEVPVHYDPLLSKLVVHAPTRPEAIARMRRAIAEYRVVGIRTNLPLFARVLGDPAFVKGDYDTSFLARLAPTQAADPARLEAAAVATALQGLRPPAAAPVGPAGGSVWWQAGLREAQRGR